MKKPLIYLDNCCFNRPYDDQSQIRISNDDNPFGERQREIVKWANIAKVTVTPEDAILRHAQTLRQAFAIHGKDAFHLACALKAGCDYFLTTDDKLIKKTRHLANLVAMNPVHFVELMEETDDAQNGNSNPL